MSMVFEQLYLGCLAQASYLIGSQGAAVIVDPRRDVDEYLQRASELELSITHILLTHVHADFVAGHTELAARTGATIHMSHRADCGFPCEPLRDGDTIEVGHVGIDVVETPGHTPTDLCFVVRDRTALDQPAKLLSGDTLFLGDVGRPDLAGGGGFSAADMAAMMYDSLRDKLLVLPDDVEVFPGHGAGSACGKNISNERSSTLGQQRLANHALQPMTKQEFVATATAELPAAPPYFGHAANLNRRGPRLLDELPAMVTLDLEEVEARRDDGAQVVDPRSAAAHGAAHLPGSINIGLSGQFESWCGTLLALDRPIVLLADDAASAAEARLRMARVGLEDVVGHALLQTAVIEDAAQLPQMSVHELSDKLAAGGWQVIDVRRPLEYETSHVPGAVHAPVNVLPHDTSAVQQLDRAAPTAVICGSGYRSSAASHFLACAGFEDLHNVTGGTNAWLDAGLEIER